MLKVFLRNFLSTLESFYCVLVIYNACVVRDGRPGGQAVDRRWRVDWLTYMASRHSYVIIRWVGEDADTDMK